MLESLKKEDLSFPSKHEGPILKLSALYSYSYPNYSV